MSDGILSLFPPQGVDQTIHIAILLGVLALLFLNESFGWVYSGLVVPGYLASLLVLAPMSTGAVMFEAVLTFAVARMLSELASKSGAWSRFFGRERFLLLVFVSVVVRQSSELWVLPEILRWVDGELGTNYRLTRDLSSIGLVLVPLTANMFWKLDLRSGLVQIAVPTLMVYVVLEYVLLPHTNLSFSALELTYENVALDFLSSPKAYIVLLIGALLGARYNLRYGWDYSGILMPALLAVACFSPFRLLTTAVESVALVLIINVMLLVPGLRNLSLQGPRKIAFVFTISFFMKFALGWYVGVPDSEAKVSDLFGFGYLVPSLIAVKMLDREAVSQILFPAFSVAIISLVLGSGIGLALDQVAPLPPVVGDGLALPESPKSTVLARTPMGVMSIARARARLDVASDIPLERSRVELDRQAELWRGIERWLGSASVADHDTVQKLAAERGMVLQAMPEPIAGRPAFALYELEERLGTQLGWNTALLIPGATGPILDVPRPATEPPTAEVAALRCAPVKCKAVIASGLDTKDAGLDVGDALANTQTPHAIALAALRAASIVRFRADPRVTRGKPILDVGDHLPELDLATLWPAQLELSWQGSPNDQVAVLRAHPDDLWLAVAAAAPPLPASEPTVTVEAWLARRLDRNEVLQSESDRGGGAPAELASYVPPSQSELRFIELLGTRLLAATAVNAADPKAIEIELRLAHALAALVGYQIHLLPDGGGPGRTTFVLAEATPKLGWGVVAGRLGQSQPVAIEVPRPLSESGTWRLGTELWLAMDASVLLIASGDRTINVINPAGTGSTFDPAAPWNMATPFQALHQAIHTALGGAALDGMIFEIRGFGATQPVREQLVITPSRPLVDPKTITGRLATALATGPLRFASKSTRMQDGAQELLDLTGTGNPQLHYCQRVDTVQCAMLWFGESTRAAYFGADQELLVERALKMGIRRAPEGVAAALLEPALARPNKQISVPLSERYGRVVKIAQAFAASGNIQVLRELVTHVNSLISASVRIGTSSELGRPFLVIDVREGKDVMRGLVMVPGLGITGAEVIVDAGGANELVRLRSALVQRPRVVTLSGTLP
jgi:hypothetical protein